MRFLSKSRVMASWSAVALIAVLAVVLAIPGTIWAGEALSEDDLPADTEVMLVDDADPLEAEPPLYTVDLREPPDEPKSVRERFQELLTTTQSFIGIRSFELISGLGKDVVEFDNILWKVNVIGNLDNDWALRFTSSIDFGSYPVNALPDDLRLTSFRVGLSKTFQIHEDYRLGAYFEAGSATVNFFVDPEPDSPEVAGGLFVDRFINDNLFVRFEYERAWSVAPFVDEYIRGILSVSAGWRF